ncbi:ABC transporter ATP-binding protein [Rhodococcus sp. NPDC057135]|uniref:ABC transporter ATP-binding protein n=1 Tax=Rhodococcus sp. NPDC057135 TaxID=3346028 RepID=UPI00363B54F9
MESQDLILENLSHSFSKDAQTCVLNDVTVKFPANTWTAVMGPSGSGKSTLLNCSAGLLVPDHGSVMLNGQDITKISRADRVKLRRKSISVIFQDFNLVPSLTALENVGLPLLFDGQTPDRSKMLQALDSVGIQNLADRRPTQLSGGEQQRVAIARALLADAAYIFADEPTGSLDSRSTTRVLEQMRNISENSQKTIVMVTHDSYVAAFAHRVIFVLDGEIVDEIYAPTAEQISEKMNHLRRTEVA